MAETCFVFLISKLHGIQVRVGVPPADFDQHLKTLTSFPNQGYQTLVCELCILDTLVMICGRTWVAPRARVAIF